MMKRMIALLLVLVMTLCAAAAWAAPGDTTLFARDYDANNSPSVTTAVAVGDTLYILVNQFDEELSANIFSLYRYTRAKAASRNCWRASCAIPAGIAPWKMPKAAQANIGADPETGFGYLFSDGEKLYGFNTLNGEIASLTFADGAMSREVVCTVATNDLYIQEEDYSYMVDINGLCCMNGHVYFASSDWRGREPQYFLYVSTWTAAL